MSEQAKAKDGKDNNCPAEQFLKFFAQEWMSHIIAVLARDGTLRFGQLRRALPGAVSARVLSARLKGLEGAGYVVRRELDGRVRHVEYALTEAGQAIDRALAQAEVLVPAANAPRAAPSRAASSLAGTPLGKGGGERMAPRAVRKAER